MLEFSTFFALLTEPKKSAVRSAVPTLGCKKYILQIFKMGCINCLQVDLKYAQTSSYLKGKDPATVFCQVKVLKNIKGILWYAWKGD